MRAGFLVLAAGVGGAYALSLYGRYRVRRELAPLGADDATSVAASLTYLDAAAAGARSLVGKNALPYSGSLTILATE